jgi:hypothetical protein
MSVEGIFRVASLFGVGAEIQRVTHERASKMKRQIRTDRQGKTTLLYARVTVSHKRLTTALVHVRPQNQLGEGSIAREEFEYQQQCGNVGNGRADRPARPFCR